MARVKILTQPSGKKVTAFYCPACLVLHQIPDGWRLSGDPDHPTLRPDVHLTIGPFAEGHPHAGQNLICHFRLDRELIRYFHDSTHAGRLRTVDLPDFDELEKQRAEEEAAASAPAPEASGVPL